MSPVTLLALNVKRLMKLASPWTWTPGRSTIPAGLYEIAAGSSGVAVTAAPKPSCLALKEAFSNPPEPTAKAGTGAAKIRATRIPAERIFFTMKWDSLLMRRVCAF